jgi:hypothetical protein
MKLKTNVKPRRRRPKKADRPHRDRYDWITLWIAAVGVVVVVASTVFTAWQADLTRQQLETTSRRERAWVKATLRNGGSVGPDGTVVPKLSLRIANVGALPATSASWRFTLGRSKNLPYTFTPPDQCGYENGELGQVRRFLLFPAEEFSADFPLTVDHLKEKFDRVEACVSYQSSNGRTRYMTLLRADLDLQAAFSGKSGPLDVVYNPVTAVK